MTPRKHPETRLPTAHRARAARLTAPAWCLALLLATPGCGEDEGGDKDTTVYTLDIKPQDAGGDTGGWTFGGDTGAAGGDSAATDSAQGDAGQGDSAQAGGDAGDAGGDTGAPAEITSCFGVCGLKLETNPCHCDHDCVARGDCCADFESACACTTLKDCDDGNQCTFDSCKDARGGKQYCMQLPQLNCCNSDAECGPAGSNPCIKPTCLQGGCSDVPKNCDDGVDCTLDSCDPKTGECSNKLKPSKCLVDGACHGAGASKPGSGGCLRCQPDVAQDSWTSAPGKCFIDGFCLASGDKATKDLDECRVCVPTKSTSEWSVASGTCFIDGKCYPGGSDDPKNKGCATCQPSKSQSAWSGVAGKCAVDGTCYAAGEGDPKVPCAVCDPAKSSSALTPKSGVCLIDGACVTDGAAKPGSGGCASCVVSASTSAWTTKKAGTTCTDDDACTIETTCTTEGLCKGKTKPNCCKSVADCNIPLGTCEKAHCKGDGTCVAIPDPECCSSGVCCDKVKGKLLPKKSQCSSFQIGSIKPAYKCEGNTLQWHAWYPGCTGNPGEQSKCSSDPSNAAPGPWQSKACGSKKCTVLADGSGVCK